MSALSPMHSFYVPLSAPPNLSLLALLDSGSSHCFIDFDFAKTHNLRLTSIPPIPLRLFDGSIAGNISFSVDLPVTFPTGNTLELSFYVTKLDSPSTAVLGLNWLTAFNPLVDWSSRTISFPTKVISEPPTPDDAATSPEESTSSDESSESPSPEPRSTPLVSHVGAAAFARACKLEGSEVYHFRLRATSDTPDTSKSSPPEATSLSSTGGSASTSECSGESTTSWEMVRRMVNLVLLLNWCVSQ